MGARRVMVVVLIGAVGGTATCQGDSGLVAWWRFDEGSGTTVIDAVGGHHGAFLGDPTWKVGIHDKTLALDGVDDGVSTPDHAELNFGTGPFTLAGWIFNQNTAASPWKRIITKRGYATTWYSFCLSAGYLTLELSKDYPDEYAVLSAGPAIQGDGLWHYVAAVRDAGGNVCLYVDGVDYPAGTAGFDLTNAEPLVLGGYEAYDGESFIGRMDDVRIYNRALTTAEIRMLAAPWQGTGTAEDPFVIGRPEEILLLAQNAIFWDADTHFELAGSIALPGGILLNPIGNEDSSFNGTFDGKGHAIVGLNQIGYLNMGLFGKTGLTAEIRNVTVTAGTMFNRYGSGMLVGHNEGHISGCCALGETNGYTYCDRVGGLVGENDGTIERCFARGTLNAGMYSSHLGGLVGRNDGSISYCYADVAIVAGSDTTILGGLVGVNFGSVSECYANGAVSNRNDTWFNGGLVGQFQEGSLTNCYASGGVGGGATSGGGLVGTYWSGDIVNCFWDTETTGRTISPGGGAGLPTAEMKQEGAFAGWDFDNTWRIMEAQSHPYQNIAVGLTPGRLGDLNGDGEVDLVDLGILAMHWGE